MSILDVKSFKALLAGISPIDITISMANKMPLDQLISNNTTITSLTVNCEFLRYMNKRRHLFYEGISKNTTIKCLQLIDVCSFDYYLNLSCNIVSLTLSGFSRSNISYSMSKLTKLDILHLCDSGLKSDYIANHETLLEFYYTELEYGSPILINGIMKNTTLTKLCYMANLQEDSGKVDILSKTNIKSLHINSYYINSVDQTSLARNTTLINLHIDDFICPKICFDNISILNFINVLQPLSRQNRWLKRNRSFIWKNQHNLITDLYIGLWNIMDLSDDLLRYNQILPLYVFWEIYNLIVISDLPIVFDSNPFAPRYKCINLMMNLQKSIMSIKKFI